MACFSEQNLQGYLEEAGPSPRHQMVENRLASCDRCRAAFERAVAKHRRVNSWLAKLSSPQDGFEVDAGGALTGVLSRVEAGRMFPTGEQIGGSRTNPRALAMSLIFQGAIVAVLMLIGTSDTVRTRISQITLLAPAVVKPMQPKPMQPKTGHAGGGGQHSPLPALKGQLPKPAPRVYTAPLVTIAHPALTMDPSLIAPPDAWAVPTGAIGNPLGAMDGLTGRGDHGGLGDGTGGSIGDSDGRGVGNGGDGGNIFSVGNGTTQPEVLSKVDPEYSEEARKAKYSGAVTLSVVVGTDGKAENIRVVRSLGMGLDEKAVEAVQKWRFRPGTNKGVAVRVRAQILVTFRLL